jgi:folate-binding protein YgfZ
MTTTTENLWILEDTNSLDERHLPECALFHLADQGLLCAEGADTQSFLQGQLTNDSNQINDSQSQLSALCTPKGRMLVLFRLLGQADRFFLQAPAELLPAIHKWLQMYVMRSQVRISDESSNWLQLGLVGSCAPDLVQELFGQVPKQRDQVVSKEGLLCLRLGGDVPRFMLLVAKNQAQALQQRLAAQAKPAHLNLWKYLCIRAGEPAVYQKTQEAFIPQMLNLEALNGLSFTKGCYTGQEVVARMQYLGKLKRQLFHARVTSNQRPAPGDMLFSPDSTSGQGAGQIVEVAATPEGGFELLAVVETKLVEQGQVHLESPDGPEIEFI